MRDQRLQMTKMGQQPAEAEVIDGADGSAQQNSGKQQFIFSAITASFALVPPV
ncbi:hypothetical protein [Raoultella terrigena]|uniref:hypothetical protein n=1 Tax=Raoultella terrigena TaxID=577 RepID=UPI001D0D81E5|nr:hypothetical protein [Raoultella terrigena]